MRMDLRIIRRPLNDVEWELVRSFAQKIDRNDIRMRFGGPLNLEQGRNFETSFRPQTRDRRTRLDAG